MSAQYYRVRKPETGRRKLLIATLLIVLVFLIDIALGGRLRAQVRVVGSGLWQGGAGVWSGFTQSGLFATRHRLAGENTALRAELAAYQARDTSYRSMAEENEELRALTGLAGSEQGFAAPITSSFSSSPYGTFQIGAGRAEGVAIGDLAIASGGAVLGRITTADLHSAQVTALFAPAATLEGLIGDVPLALDGYGGGNARGKAPREASIGVGDIVVSPAEGGRTVGFVGRVDSEASTAYQEVFIVFPANLGTLRFVYVVRE